MASNTAKRKLTTILAADVVAYGQLMAADEETTLTTLRTYREITDALVEKHNGRVFNTAGDAFLAEFGSAVEAVRCAISIQEDLAVRNSQRNEDRQMWFRIGINVGDVMVENEDLFGDGVNVAARLEGLAEKGGICISGSTFDQVKNKLSVAFDDIGAQKVKNIPDPVPAFRIVRGQVAVKNGAGATAFPGRPGVAGTKLRNLMTAGIAIFVVLLGGVYFTGLVPFGDVSSYPFDGHWKVTVDSLSGCRNNNPRSFALDVRHGKIDEPHHPFPKQGLISANGEFSLRTTDRAGNLKNTQVGKITGDVGRGSFQGRKPGCTGDVMIVRLE